MREPNWDAMFRAVGLAGGLVGILRTPAAEEAGAQLTAAIRTLLDRVRAIPEGATGGVVVLDHDVPDRLLDILSMASDVLAADPSRQDVAALAHRLYFAIPAGTNDPSYRTHMDPYRREYVRPDFDRDDRH